MLQRIGTTLSLNTIKELAFYNTRVEKVNFPEGLEHIKAAAFYGCDLIEAILPGTLKELSDGTFSMCPKLKEIKIAEGITKIPFDFVSYCQSLEKVNIPKSVTVIEDDAFSFCSLDSIVFPATIEYIGKGAFKDLKKLKKIYSMSPMPPVCYYDPMVNFGDGPFGGSTPSDIPVYVPIGSGEKYREAFGWNYFTNIIETDKFPTGIVLPKMGNNELCKVYGKGNELVIEIPNLLSSPIHYSIYSIEGTMIEQGNLIKSYTLRMSAKGVYIVRVGNTTHKIFM